MAVLGVWCEPVSGSKTGKSSGILGSSCRPHTGGRALSAVFVVDPRDWEIANQGINRESAKASLLRIYHRHRLHAVGTGGSQAAALCVVGVRLADRRRLALRLDSFADFPA